MYRRAVLLTRPLGLHWSVDEETPTTDDQQHLKPYRQLSTNTHTHTHTLLKQESRAVAGNPRDAAVIFDP